MPLRPVDTTEDDMKSAIWYEDRWSTKPQRARKTQDHKQVVGTLDIAWRVDRQLTTSRPGPA